MSIITETLFVALCFGVLFWLLVFLFENAGASTPISDTLKVVDMTNAVRLARNSATLQDQAELNAWLEDPTLFWLNPDGPLSDLTPEEYRRSNPPARVIHLMPGEEVSDFWPVPNPPPTRMVKG